MNINKAGLDLVKHFEGCYLKAYRCPAGVPTIGWGHTGSDVKMGDEISKATAERLLELDMCEFEIHVGRLVKVPVTSNQFSALVSFCFNLGAGALGASTLLRLLNARDYDGAKEQFKRWNKARVGGKLQVLAGLSRRRKTESQLFGRADVGDDVPPIIPDGDKCTCSEQIKSLSYRIETAFERIAEIESRLNNATVRI